MSGNLHSKQAGITFSGFIVGLFVLVILVLFGFKLIPAYMENAKIQNIFETISHDPQMQKASPYEITLSYDRRASVDGITGIQSKDIELDVGQDGRSILSAIYIVKVKLGGNVSLVMDFNPTSAGK